MRIRTVAGLTIAGAAAAAAMAGGVAISTADENDPVVRIVTEDQPAGNSGTSEDSGTSGRSIQDDGRDCPDKSTGAEPAPTETGL